MTVKILGTDDKFPIHLEYNWAEIFNTYNANMIPKYNHKLFFSVKKPLLKALCYFLYSTFSYLFQQQ